MVSNPAPDSTDFSESPTRRRLLALVAAVGGASLAGCVGTSDDSDSESDGSSGSNASTDSEGANSSGGNDTGDANAVVDEWMRTAVSYDGIVDETGTDRVSVRVGADSPSGPYAYDPAAVRVSAGTTVVWEWVAASGAHNVVEQDGAFESELYSSGDATFEYTADEPGTYLYYCTPHRGLGMKGAIVVDES